MAAPRLTAGRFGLCYLTVLLVVVGLDAIWLGGIAAGFYRHEMGALMSTSVRVVPALVFYLLYPLAFVYLVLHREPAGRGEALGRAAAFGLAAYGAYDLTNMAVVAGWPVGLSLLDWAWGGVAATLAGAAGHAVGWGHKVSR